MTIMGATAVLMMRSGFVDSGESQFVPSRMGLCFLGMANLIVPSA